MQGGVSMQEKLSGMVGGLTERCRELAREAGEKAEAQRRKTEQAQWENDRCPPPGDAPLGLSSQFRLACSAPR